MSTPKHTPEPWQVAENGQWHIVGIATFYNGRRNADRAVQCVNDCAGMDDPAAEIARLRSELAEATAALLNERGEGEPPVEGWTWNGDICWEHRNMVHRIECYAVGEWRVQENDGRWVTKSTHPTARAAMRAASEALAHKEP